MIITPSRKKSIAKVRPSTVPEPKQPEEPEVSEEENHVEEVAKKVVEEEEAHEEEEPEVEAEIPKKPKTPALKRSTVRSALKIKLSNGHQQVLHFTFYDLRRSCDHHHPTNPVN